ncbi:thioredoxin domain-containing protein [Candidatus Daviesbacteria bacterium]|nr:thioredoxin domain-containing protein [Candidatus Daviesbacteria bacterium]
MKTETKILGAILIGTLVLLVGGILLLSRGNSGPAGIEGASVSQIDYSKGQKIGSDSAKVKLVEFSDFQCPACAAAEPSVRSIRISYPDQVQFIYRHFPLPQHAFGRVAAAYAEAAGEQGKFWEMHERLFETQSEWSGLSKKEAAEFFLKITGDLGLDENKIKEQVNGNTIQAKIDSDLVEGRNLGVNSTPTFFLNGRKLTLQRFEDLNTAVSNALK